MKSDGCGPWPTIALGEVVEIRHGFAFKGEFFRDEGPGDILLTPGNFAVGGGFTWHKTKYYSGPVDHRFVLRPGDLIITMTDLSRGADTLGSPAIVPPPPEGARLLHNQRLGLVEITAPDRIDPRFLYSVLRTNLYRRQVVASATGTTVKHTSPPRIGEALIPLPPLGDQQTIARILGALDDKIDSNRRLARLLEETAATLFRARFVDFVGVEEFEESEIGRIPRGWSVGTLAEVAEVHRDLVKGADDLPYIGLDSMPKGSSVLTDWQNGDGAPSGQAARFEVGDILFGKLRPYFHKVGVAPIRGRCSTEILVLRPVAPELYGLALGHVASKAFIEHCVAVSRGTRMPRAEWSDAGSFKIAIPPVADAATFTDLVRHVYAYIRTLTLESRTLATIRDALLPKLVSGEIRVPDAADPAEMIEPALA